MPFTPPAGYASQSTTGYQSVFSIGAIASPHTLMAVLEVKTIKTEIGDVPQVAASHLLSPLNTEEFFPGMIKPGTVELGGNFIGTADQLYFNLAMQAQALVPWSVVSNVGRGKTYTQSGICYVSKYSSGPFENNKTIEFSVTVQIAGAITETVAS